MNIEELIKQAASTSPTFKRKWLYWVVTRNRAPQFDWLMNNLELALGREYMQEQAQLAFRNNLQVGSDEL